MPNQYFKFKQFTLYQDKCAMKVGTDGTLLGAWVDVFSSKRMLDIGTGTGLIALMLAQRNSDAIIDAIDIDPDAYIQATENVKNSPFSNQIYTYHSPIQLFVTHIRKSYDLIVSNPPYFENSFKSPEQKRNVARHNDNLSLPELIEYSVRLLTPNGRIALIIPYIDKDKLFKYTIQNNLHCTRQTNIIPVKGMQPKRILIELSRHSGNFKSEELILESARNRRTKEYHLLTKDFYL